MGFFFLQEKKEKNNSTRLQVIIKYFKNLYKKILPYKKYFRPLYCSITNLKI